MIDNSFISFIFFVYFSIPLYLFLILLSIGIFFLLCFKDTLIICHMSFILSIMEVCVMTCPAFDMKDITHSDVNMSKVMLIRKYSNGCYYLEVFLPDGSKKSIGAKSLSYLYSIMEHLGIRKCLLCSTVDLIDNMEEYILHDGVAVYMCKICKLCKPCENK